MMVLRNVLLLVLMFEGIFVAVGAWGRLDRTEPPVVDPRRLDPVTAADIQRLWEAARDGQLEDWRTLAEAYLGNSYYVEAEQCFHHVAEQNPADTQAIYARGFCLERVGETTAAIAVLTQAVEQADDELSRTCWYQIGRCYLREEKAEEAEAAFRRVRGFHPASFQLAKLLIRSGRADEAIPLIDEVLAAVPNSLKMLQQKRYAAEALGKAELARQLRDQEERAAYQLVLEYGQRFISMFSVQSGLSQMLSKAIAVRDDGALAQRQAALREPLQVVLDNQLWQYQSVLLAAAHVELGLGNLDRSKELLEVIEKDTHADVKVLELRAMFAEAEGDLPTAHALWERSAGLTLSSETYERLAGWKGEVDVAARRRHLALAHLRAGIDAWRKNDIEEAAELLKGCEPELAEDDLYLFYLGETKRLLGQRDGAEMAYERCLMVNPDHGRSLDRLAAIALPGPQATE